MNCNSFGSNSRASSSNNGVRCDHGLLAKLQIAKGVLVPKKVLFLSKLTLMMRPQITEIHVRMDCNGCVQKIKKALNGINGIYDLYIDFPQQKLTVIGWADPERIIKAIKKVRKVATICSHTEAPDPNSQPTEPQPPDDSAQSSEGGAPPPQEGGPPPQDAGNPQPTEPPKSDEAPPPPQEQSGDQAQVQAQAQPQPQPQQHETSQAQNPQPESNPPPEHQQSQQANPHNPPPEEVHVVHHHAPDYGYRYGYNNGYGYNSYGGHWPNHPGPSYRPEPHPQPIYHEPPPQHVYHERPRPIYHEPPPHPVYHEPPPRPIYHEPPPRTVYHEPPPQNVYATHSYNMYRPSPSITEYQYVHPPPQYTNYGMSRMDPYNMDPYRNGSHSNGNVTSIFSDENPNACTIA